MVGESGSAGQSQKDQGDGPERFGPGTVMARNPKAKVTAPEIAAARDAAAAIEYLRERDPVLKAVIDRVGPFALEPEPDVFRSLVRAIIAQQISTGAARSIYQKLISLAGGEDRLLQ